MLWSRLEHKRSLICLARGPVLSKWCELNREVLFQIGAWSRSCPRRVIIDKLNWLVQYFALVSIYGGFIGRQVLKQIKAMPVFLLYLHILLGQSLSTLLVLLPHISDPDMHLPRAIFLSVLIVLSMERSLCLFLFSDYGIGRFDCNCLVSLSPMDGIWIDHVQFALIFTLSYKYRRSFRPLLLSSMLLRAWSLRSR